MRFLHPLLTPHHRQHNNMRRPHQPRSNMEHPLNLVTARRLLNISTHHSLNISTRRPLTLCRFMRRPLLIIRHSRYMFTRRLIILPATMAMAIRIMVESALASDLDMDMDPDTTATTATVITGAVVAVADTGAEAVDAAAGVVVVAADIWGGAGGGIT